MSSQNETKRPLFTVSNHHVADSSQPLFYDGDEDKSYLGYFTNVHGEQAIFHYDRETKQATLRMGDAGWEREYIVTNGRAEGLLLDRAEQLWLAACWEAATGQSIT